MKSGDTSFLKNTKINKCHLKCMLSVLLIFCMIIILLSSELSLLFANNFSANAEEFFSYDIYKANVITQPSKHTKTCEQLITWLDETSSPNTVVFEAMDSNKGFKNSIAAWETTNLIFDPMSETVESFDEVSYYESIILNVLQKTFSASAWYDDYFEKGTNIINNTYAFFEDDSNLAYYIRNYKDLTKSEIKDFDETMKKAIQKDYPIASKISDFMENFDTFCIAADSVYDVLDSAVTYLMCYEMEGAMRDVIKELYTNCDGLNNPAMKLALSDINDACNSKVLSVANAVSGGILSGGFQITAKYSDAFLKSCIASAFPPAKALLLTQSITKSVVNFFLSTDKICEQYYKSRQLYNFEMLLRSTIRKIKSDYISTPSEQQANKLFCIIDMFAKTYKISGDLAIDFAELMYKENIVSLFNTSEKYNNFTQSVQNICNYAETYRNEILNTGWLHALEMDYPEKYKAYTNKNKIIAKPSIRVLGISFEKDEIEVGMEDSYALLNPIISPVDATNKTLNCSSSNPTVATCYGDTITPISPGTTVITALSIDGTVSAQVTVHVVEGKGADGVYIEPLKLPINVGEKFSIKNLKYEVTSNETAKLIEYDNIEPEGNLYIPNSVSYRGNLLDITGIDSFIFENCSKLTSIHLPKGLTKLEAGVFSGCSGLTNIEIPDGVTAIENGTPNSNYGAFCNCAGLKSIVIPDSVKTIGAYSFYDCAGLESVTIGSSVTTVAAHAFSGCNIKKLIFSDGIKAINDDMTDCMEESLEQVIIPDSVTSIEANTFSNCNKLQSVFIPKSMKSIKNNAFSNCNKLSDIYFWGSQKDWNIIEIESGNDVLSSVAVHYDFTPPAGDADLDAQFSVTDIVMLQKWLLGSGNLTYWKACDLYEDGIINIIDFFLMKHALINK